MILKVQDDKGGWTLRGELERVHYQWLGPNDIEKMLQYADDLMLIDYEKLPEKDGKKQYNPNGKGCAMMILFTQHGVTHTAIVNTTAFLLNDEGKTIQRI